MFTVVMPMSTSRYTPAMSSTNSTGNPKELTRSVWATTPPFTTPGRAIVRKVPSTAIVANWTRESGSPSACAVNRTTPQSMTALPSLFSCAPSGRVKEYAERGSPMRPPASSEAERLARLLQVEAAVVQAVAARRKKSNGFRRARNRSVRK